MSSSQLSNPELIRSNLRDERYQFERPATHLGQKVTKALKGLVKVSKSEGLDLCQVAELFVTLPTMEDEELTDLEQLDRCILTAQQIIENSCPALSRVERVVKEYRLMGGLFQLWAEQLED